MQYWWNDNGKEKPNYSSKIKLSQCHFVHCASHMYWSGIEARPPW